MRDYAVVTASYWVFTITDGALRMLVLLYLHEQGFAPLAIAAMFVLYEVLGIVTTASGGWLGARFGLKTTLVSGLALQIGACALLAAGAGALTVSLVLVAQAACGVAKDLTKTGAKSYIKLVVPAGGGRGLLRWVAVLTGSKNTLKGVGFFAGGALLAGVGFAAACWIMAAALALALVASAALLPRAAGKAKRKPGLAALLGRNARVRWLSAARLFLFGSRDVWFVVALPIFLSASLGWSFTEVGGFLAVWVIGYGIVQACAPAWAHADRAHARSVAAWTGLLVVPLGAIAAGLAGGARADVVLVVGLAAFGFVFATVSALHSYLVLAYAEGDDVALSVGFYYMANAAGRLAGTVLSGAVFEAAGLGERGLVAAIATSIGFVVVSAALCAPLARAERRAAAV